MSKSKKPVVFEAPLYAFWRYDLFPFVCGASVNKMDERGLVSAPSYGGSWFKPLLLLPHEAGLEIQKVLDASKAEMRRRKEEIEKQIESSLIVQVPRVLITRQMSKRHGLVTQ